VEVDFILRKKCNSYDLLNFFFFFRNSKKYSLSSYASYREQEVTEFYLFIDTFSILFQSCIS